MVQRLAWLGAAGVWLGLLTLLAAAFAGRLHPDVSADLTATRALEALVGPLEAAAAAGRASPLARELRGAALLQAVGVDPVRMAREHPQIDLDALLQAVFSPDPIRYRLEYRGDRSTEPDASRSILALQPGGRWELIARHAETVWAPWQIPLALVGLALLIAGWWAATRGIFARTLTRQLLAASVAGVAVLTLLLFVAASLQFVDRFSFLGPAFFLDNAWILILQAIPYTLAFGLLAGATVVIGRMAADREDTILQFNGVPLRVVAVPVIVVGGLFSTLTFLAAHVAEPEGLYGSDMLPYRSLGVVLERLPKGAFALSERSLPFHLTYAQRENERFLGVTIVFVGAASEGSDADGLQRPAVVLVADEARILYSEALAEVQFRLFRCMALRYESWPHDAAPRTLYLETLDLRQAVFAGEGVWVEGARRQEAPDADAVDWLPQFAGLQAPLRRTRTESMAGLPWAIARARERAEAWREERAEVVVREQELNRRYDQVRIAQIGVLQDVLKGRFDRARAAVRLPAAPQPIDRESVARMIESAALDGAEIQELLARLEPHFQAAAAIRAEPMPRSRSAAEVDQAVRDVLRADTEWARRWAVSLAPIAFLFLAVPLGLLVRQGNLLVAFAVTLLVVLVVWFGVLSWLERAARDGLVDPWWVAAGPTCSGVGTGLLLLAWALRLSLVPRRSRSGRRSLLMMPRSAALG